MAGFGATPSSGNAFGTTNTVFGSTNTAGGGGLFGAAAGTSTGLPYSWYFSTTILRLVTVFCIVFKFVQTQGVCKIRTEQQIVWANNSDSKKLDFL
jgi:hypothetical protein